MTPKWLLAFAVVLLLTLSVWGQATQLKFKQERDGDAVKVLSNAEFATLGDPLFQLLLKENAGESTLEGIMDKLQPGADKRQLFIVHEKIVSEKQAEGVRRGVVAFTGTNGSESLKGNVMLSIAVGANGKVLGDIEAWGWDNHRGRYNYYKLDELGAPSGKVVWKFRGSSENADLLSAAERKGTCLQCHTTGAPVMKELLFPWNNWHSKVGGAFKANYLDPASTHPAKWPAAATPLFSTLSGAETLETDHLIPAFKRFNESRVNALLLREDGTGNRLLTNGRLTLTSSNRVLRSLFVPTEVNLISSRDGSGFHPFGAATDFVPDKEIRLPEDFFLHTSLIAGGLKLISAKKFNDFAKLKQSENKALIEKFELRLNGKPGDTHFAWLVPTPSFIDTDMAERLMKLGVVTPHFLAAVLAVDLEEPLFSTKRAELLKYLPDRIEFTPLAEGTDPTTLPHDAEKDLLTKTVIAKIDADNPAPGSAADEFRTLLKDADAVKLLDKKCQAYAARVETALKEPTTRPAELERLFTTLVNRRKAMLKNPLFAPLDETGGKLLFALPAPE